MTLESLPPLRLDVLTADPLLRFLVAAEGYEDPPFQPSWRAFKRFAQLPTLVRDGGATFQVLEPEVSHHSFEVFFGRELAQQTEGDWEDARIIGIHFLFTSPEPPRPRELWSGGFPSIADFFATVESGAYFQAACRSPLLASAFYVEELG